MLQLFSISHKSTSPQKREDLKWSEFEIASLKENLGLNGIVVLQTCNRIELIIDCSQKIKDQILNIWCQKSTEASRKDCVMIIENDACVTKYLLELSTGLHSAILLDDQIHGQVKKAFMVSLDKNWHSTRLERVFQTLMRYHKALINKTSFRKGSTSLSYNVHKEIRKLSDSKKDKSLLIIGAGDMAQQIVKFIPSFRYNSVTIANRSLLKARRLALDRNVIYKGLSDISRLIDQHDIIINCIGHDIFNNHISLDVDQILVDLSDNLILGNKLSGGSKVIILEDLNFIIKKNETEKTTLLSDVYPIINNFVQEYCNWSDNYTMRRRA